MKQEFQIYRGHHLEAGTGRVSGKRLRLPGQAHPQIYLGVGFHSRSRKWAPCGSIRIKTRVQDSGLQPLSLLEDFTAKLVES